MQDVVILSAARTPIGMFQGSLSDLRAPELGAFALKGALAKADLKPADLEQVYLGCVLPAGIGQAPARQAALGAGCPTAVGAITINKVCGSGMRAVMSAANDLRCGEYGLVAAGGMESMSNSPYLAKGIRGGLRLGHGELIDSMIHDGLWDPYKNQHMGNCGETCAAHYGFTREEQDAFAIESYRRAQAAIAEGRFVDEIVKVEIAGKKGASTVIAQDEEPGRANFEKMLTLRPAFQKDGGTITAANGSKLNDGAAALILTTADNAKTLGKKPIARLVSQATFAHEPEWFTTAPVEATRRALQKANLEAGDIDLYEFNEAFAVVPMAAIKDLGLDAAKVNVNGGAIAIGHPIGASGARILVTLLYALEKRGGRYGCASICLGGGEATSVIVERL